MPTTVLTGTVIRSGSIPTTALGGGVISSSVQLTATLPAGTVSSSTQVDITSTSGFSTFSSSVATKNNLQDVSLNALNAATSSYAINATIQNQLAGVASSSAQVKAYLPDGSVSSSAQFPGWVTASSQIDYNSITNKLSGVVSSSAQVKPLLPDGTVSSSAQFPGWVTASSQIDYNSIQNKLSAVVSSSTQIISLLPAGTISASSQVTLNTITGATFSNSAFYFPSNLRVEGTLTAQEINTEFVSSSVIFESGSSKFGDTNDDVMSVTGSIRVLGGNISGSFIGLVSESSQINYNSIQNKLSDVVSSSTQVKSLLPGGTVSSSAQFPGWVTSSTQIVWASVNYNQDIVSSSTQVKSLLPGGSVSSSAQFPGWVTASSQVAISGVSGLGTNVAAFLATPSSANLAAALTDETGTGASVFANSPTLVTPVLGTPSSVTLTNATGLPVSTGISGLGTGVATFLATPSSANLASALTDETGTGANVFAASPTLSGTVTADKMVLSGSQFSGVVSGSGTLYRLVVPVGTNQYAT